ncbi:DUF3363 domain-containing protein [Erythrobacter rubeus]|uniref:DUF3363 domain-containing protein n=1 Tax=Erythrobacter rubeus TaxID=2760803 RepID=A0ABR8KVT3_9SPHN|nr:DUF3363 domain-containing protein [Erythrobacter rubeus]MBD2843500.1 DUF3363 domain-containing protein [Erythrobacter rubeus]
MPLTAISIKNAKPRAKPYKIADAAALYLLVKPNGAKLWRMNYVYLTKHKTLAFGVWPEVSLAQARVKRDEARNLIAAGLDPAEEARLARLRAIEQSENTFKAVAEEWFTKNEREGKASVTLRKIRWLLDKAYPTLGHRPIAKIGAQEVLLVLRKVEAKGHYESARRMRSVISRVFRYGIATARAERDIAADLRGALITPQVKHLAAITTAEEAGTLLRAIEGYSGHATTQFALRLSPHLFVRPGELRMAQMEEDLGTKLDWVAVDHFNTGHPHSHIMLRGVDDRGENLVIAREYIAHGMRERAMEIATLDLGPRTDLEIEERLRHDIGEERLTAIDRRLNRQMNEQRIVSASDRDPFQQSLRAGRLQKLGKLGLAADVGGGHWQLADGFDETLRRMGERGDITRTMQRELTAAKLDRSASDQAIFDPTAKDPRPIIGRVVTRGLADELHDRHFLIIDGVDGRTHYVGIGKGDAVEPLAEGSIVQIEARAAKVRKSDRTIAEVAAANGGRYSVDAHLKHDPSASEEFAQTHVRRLEAMRRMMGSVEREADGSWQIDENHLDKAAAYEARRMRDRPVAVDMLSPVPLRDLPQADAATWLDRELIADKPVPVRDAGFGREVKAAATARTQWLVEQGLAEERDDQVIYRKGMVETLRRRELMRVASKLSDELELRFVEAKAGERIEGTFHKRVDMTSGRYALVAKSKEFTLAPWKSVLGRHVGKTVSGIARGDRTSWKLGRGRSEPTIS